MAGKKFTNVIGIDDSPFTWEGEKKVPIIGAVMAHLRLEGVLMTRVGRDGSDANAGIAQMIADSRFYQHIQLVMLQGIAVAGFNVVDVKSLARQLQRPVLVVSRRKPDPPGMRKALYRHIPAGAEKWRSVEALGPMEPVGPVFIQRAGLGFDSARQVLNIFCIHGHIPEPIRIAHMVAGAVGRGYSRGAP